MNALKLFLLLTLLMAIAIAVSASSGSTGNIEDDHALIHDNNDVDTEVESSDESESPEMISLRGVTSRFLPQKTRTKMTCNYYPRICRVKGSPGPDCCKKKCVNVSTDRYNCGKCGKKCKYHEICCKGMCINPFSNKKHCGGCNNNCKKGSSCVYGLCSYA